MFYANGDKFLGHFKQNEFEGDGKYISKSGESAEGEFSKGILIHSNKTKTCEGEDRKNEVDKIILRNNFHDKKCFIKEKNKIKFRSFAHQLTSFSNGSKNSKMSTKEEKDQKNANKSIKIVRAIKHAKLCQKICKKSNLHSWKLKKCSTEEPLKLKDFLQSQKRNKKSSKKTEFEIFNYKKNYSDGHSINFEESKFKNKNLFLQKKGERNCIYSQSSFSPNLTLKSSENQLDFKIEDESEASLLSSRTIGLKLNFIKNRFRKDFLTNV